MFLGIPALVPLFHCNHRVRETERVRHRRAELKARASDVVHEPLHVSRFTKVIVPVICLSKLLDVQ